VIETFRGDPRKKQADDGGRDKIEQNDSIIDGVQVMYGPFLLVEMNEESLKRAIRGK